MNANSHRPKKQTNKQTGGSTAADSQPLVEELWIKRMSCDLELNLFVWGTTMRAVVLPPIYADQRSGFIVLSCAFEAKKKKKNHLKKDI